MLAENQKVELCWSRTNKRWFVDKGYFFTKIGDTFIVDANDLMKTDKHKVIALCDYCGKPYEIIYESYYKNILKNKKNACQNCIYIKMNETTLEKRQDKIYHDLLQKLNDKNYVLLTPKDEITGINCVIKILCNNHGEQEVVVSQVLYHNCSCKKCGIENGVENRVRNSLEKRREHLYQRLINECQKHNYTLITQKEEIENNKSYIQYICPKHGMRIIQIYNMLNGRGCYECALENASDRYKLSIDEVISRIDECGGKVLNPEEYKNQHEKNLRILCPECGNDFITSFANFVRHGGQVCEDCGKTRSVGELKIRKYLQDKNIIFEEQKYFSDCKDVRPLPFDFYLPTYNTTIEFDGRQHFIETNYFSYSFEKTLQHDNIKNEYCKKKNIKLIRIPYWEKNNITEILNKKLILNT